MSRLTLARRDVARSGARALAAATTAVLLILVGCTSEPAASARGSFCEVRPSSSPCKEPARCDDALTSACASLDGALSGSTLTAANDCLESGVCGAASCLGRAQTGAKPTPAHLSLAESFCTSCAPGVADCQRQFYARKSKLPGGLVLPYSEAVAAAVEAECVGQEDSCRSTFAPCATGVIARALRDSLDDEVAGCVEASFRREDGATGPGGRPVVTTCAPSNCDGCCRDDKCEKGNRDDVCGAGGAACQICGGAQRCILGACAEPCGPNNCTGCCDGETCLPGTETSSCGGEGGACKKCASEGSTFICSNKQCIDGSCQASCTTGCCSPAGCQPGTAPTACGTGGEGCFDCGAGRVCNAATRSCQIDPDALWDFYVSFASVPSTDRSGAAWDVLNGAPDPYLIAYSSEGVSTHTGSTAVRADTTAPVWMETPVVGVKASELLNNLTVELWDSDVDYDDLIGGCKLPLKASAFDASLQSYKCPATPNTVDTEIYFRIQRHREP